VDGWVAERLHDAVRDHPLVVDVLVVVTALGRPQALAVTSVVVAIALVAGGRPRQAVFVVVATIGAWLIDNALKDLVDRARPVWEEPLARSSGASFPSGHAMVAGAFYAAVAILVRRRWVTIAMAVVIAVIAMTRVALGVHWLSDVIVGAVLGAAWAWTCARLVLRDRVSRPPLDA
jgi:membrane-associated phospholipid phosphatase